MLASSIRTLQNQGPLPRPTSAPKAIERGQAEVLLEGEDGCFLVFGGIAGACVAAAKNLREDGLNFGVISARFVKPLDTATVLGAIENLPLVVTVEEGTREGGFGSAVLEAANAAGLDTRNVLRLAYPDQFIEHGERNQLLADMGLDPAGLTAAVRKRVAADAESGSLSGAGLR